MSHQDQTSSIVVNHQAIKQVVDWLLSPALFAGMSVRSTATWKPRMLAVAALLWATADGRNLTHRFELARKITGKIFRWQNAPGSSYQGFIKMLHKWHTRLLQAICPHLREKMKEILPEQGRIAGYSVFAGDGSRVELARTKSLEDAYSPHRKKKARKEAARKRRRQQSKSADRVDKVKATKKQSDESVAKKENSPQMWLTLLWHVGSGLPWAWRTGPSDSSERGHLEEMIPELPKNSLITADAGFVGYDFWSTILNAGHHFVIRVGGNVRLLKKLAYAREYEHTVYLWPDSAAKKKLPPLVLRLIVIHNGRQPVYLVTNLSKSQLSNQQAGKIYSARWGIELFFRTFKQTFGCRKLRSRCAKNAVLELDWSLLGLWCICLLGQRELAAAGESPTELSAAAAIKALQNTLNDYRVRPEGCGEMLWTKLQLAVLDGYHRTSSKMSRNYPRKKQRESMRGPQIKTASKQQAYEAEQLKEIWLAA